MNLYSREIYRLQSIEYCHARMGIGCRIYDDTVKFPQSTLYFINYVPLVVRLKILRLKVERLDGTFYVYSDRKSVV